MSALRTFVYFIATKDRSVVKIGWSRRPVDRLSSISCWSPLPLEIIAFAPGSMDDEHAIQHRFKHLHSHGEWFHGASDILDVAEKIAAAGQIPDEYKAAPGVRYPALRPVREHRTRTPQQRENMRKISQARWDGIRASRKLWGEIDQFLLDSGMSLSDFIKAMGWLPAFVKFNRDSHPHFAANFGEKVRAFIDAHWAVSGKKAAGT